MPTDEILVRETLSGDKNAFGKLVEKYSSAVYGQAYHLVGNFADAQDLAQEAFTTAFLKLHQLEDHTRFAGWLRTITVNICRMWLRKQKEEISRLEEIDEQKMHTNQLSPEDELIAKEERDMVMRAIASLSEKSQLTVTLYYLDGMTYEEIANFLGVTRSAIDSRLQRARKRLKQEMLKMTERTFKEHKLPEDFRTRVMESLSQRWVDVYGKREDVIGYALCGDAARNELWEGSVIEMVFLREAEEKIGLDRNVAPAEMSGLERGMLITGFDISTGKMATLMKDEDAFCKSIIPPRLYGCRILDDPKGKLADYKQYVESTLISPEVINKRTLNWLTKAKEYKAKAEEALEIGDYASGLWFVRHASLSMGCAAFIKHGGYPGEILELCRRFPALLKQTTQEAGIPDFYENFAIIQGLGKGKAAVRENLHKFRELMFKDVYVLLKVDEYEGTMEKREALNIFRLGFDCAVAWHQSMELWDAAINSDYHDGILLMFRSIIGGITNYPLGFMFEMERILCDKQVDQDAPDFVRQLSTFQHVPEEVYPLFLEVFDLAEASVEKTQKLMKRLEAMSRTLAGKAAS